MGPKTVVGSRSSAAVRPVKCTSPATATVNSRGAADDEEDVAGEGDAAETAAETDAAGTAEPPDRGRDDEQPAANNTATAAPPATNRPARAPTSPSLRRNRGHEVGRE